MLEISGKVQWSTLFLHHKTVIFIFTHKAYNNGLSKCLTMPFSENIKKKWISSYLTQESNSLIAPWFSSYFMKDSVTYHRGSSLWNSVT